MKIAMIGLGKMGANMSTRLLRGGHEVVAYDLNETAIRAAEAAGATGARTLDEAAAALPSPRVAWVMVPSGAATEATVNALAERFSPGDILIDGGNSNYKDSMRRAAALQARGLHFVDVGTSGGVWGLAEGYSLMIGGDEQVVAGLRPIFATLAPAADKGWGRVQPWKASPWRSATIAGRSRCWSSCATWADCPAASTWRSCVTPQTSSSAWARRCCSSPSAPSTGRAPDCTTPAPPFLCCWTQSGSRIRPMGWGRRSCGYGVRKSYGIISS